MPNYDHLLEQQINEPNATSFELCPEGEWLASIDDFVLGTAEWTDKQTQAPKSAPTLKITWSVLDEGVKARLKLDQVRVLQDLFLDLDDTTGQLSVDKNKNIMLGRIRQAVHLNEPGQAFALPMLKGAAPALVRVGWKEDKNKIMRANVTGVTRAARG